MKRRNRVVGMEGTTFSQSSAWRPALAQPPPAPSAALILNLNVQVWDVAAQNVVFTKSVDMRGNNDESWNRAVPYLVRDMAEKRARNPRYRQ